MPIRGMAGSPLRKNTRCNQHTLRVRHDSRQEVGALSTEATSTLGGLAVSFG